MAPPPVELFSTSILSNVKVRTRHERYTSVLAIKKIPYIYHDLASDDDAKSRWRRKAKDPQLPGLLVNNEWIGSFDDFEEAIEFGELELFLGIANQEPTPPPTQPHPAQSAISSKDPSLYPTLPYAAEGAGRGPEQTADDFISSLGISEHDIKDADVDELLAEIETSPPVKPIEPVTKYIPSQEAAIKPLRFAKMGSGAPRQPSGSSSTIPSSPRSPIARYSATQRSTQALVAEASALTSNRKTSGALLREAVSQGKTLDHAMAESKMKDVVSEASIDDLFASLGLKDVDIAEDEVDEFLAKGAIPQGLRYGGDRVNRPSSVADKARDETVARQLAQRAKEKGYGRARSSSANDANKSHASPASSQSSALVKEESSDEPGQDGELSNNMQESSRKSALAKVDSDKIDLAPTSNVEDTKAENEAPEPELDSTPATNNDDTNAGEASGSADPKTEVNDATSTAGQGVDESDHARVVTPQEGSIAAEVSLLEASQESADKVDTNAPEDVHASESADISVPDQGVANTFAEPKGDEERAETPDAATTPAEKPFSIKEKTVNPVTTKGDAISDGQHEATPPSPVKAISEDPTAVSAEATKESEEEEDPKTADIEALKGKASESGPPDPVKEDGTDLPFSKQQKLHSDEAASVTPTADAGLSTAIQLDSTSTSAADLRERPQSRDLNLDFVDDAFIASQFEMAGPFKGDRLEKQDKTSRSSSHEAIESRVDEGKDADKSVAASSSAASPPMRQSSANDMQHVKPFLTPSKVSPSPSRSPTQQHQPNSAPTSARRAIDVSRPIDPDSYPLYEPASSPSAMMTKKKRGMSFRGFGKEKDKEKDHGKTRDTKAGPAPAAIPSRHERTISQILREADAVLQMDDRSDDNDDLEDDEEARGIFGNSSGDTNYGAAKARSDRA